MCENILFNPYTYFYLFEFLVIRSKKKIINHNLDTFYLLESLFWPFIHRDFLRKHFIRNKVFQNL
jgi:hypothetical protein